MIEITASWYVLLATGLFTMGVLGLLTQSSAIRILMSIELILNAANINFVALGTLPSPFSPTGGSMEGLTYALLSIALAAAEAAVGLAIFVNLYRVRGDVLVGEANLLKG